MDATKRQVVLTETEIPGLYRMRELNEEFLAENKCSDEVLKFMEKAGADKDLMLLYLRARKNQPEQAWETLKKKAEVRFDLYPEVFVEKPARFHEELQEIGLWGILKNRDRFERSVVCIRGCKWDPNVYNTTDLTNALLQLTEKLLFYDNAIENGVVMIGDADGMGLSYVRHFGLNFMLRCFETFWLACPLEIKGIYYVNVPFCLTFAYELIKPFLPKELKEKIFLTSCNRKFIQLHANVDKKILPAYLGGSLEYSEAFEFVKF